jgi:4-amino-4-deoxy-L-arabinose transferase-like glycosyltransferase
VASDRSAIAHPAAVMKRMLVANADGLWLAAIIAGFIAHGVLFALYLFSWDAEWSYVWFGNLAVRGELRLFQDEMLGERLPLPFYVIGLSQWMGGPSLLAGRLTSLLLGVGVVLGTYALGRAIGGRPCGLLSALFLVTHSLVIGYYAAASYFAFCALLIVAGLLAIAAGPPPWGAFTGMASISLLSVSRANLAVMVPAVLLYLLLRARSSRERAGLVAIAALPPAMFFAWSSEHWKILAYVPLLWHLVEPLGYRSMFTLGAQDLLPEPDGLAGILWFGKRHFFWIVTSTVLLLYWALGRRPRPSLRSAPPLMWFIVGLSLYTLAWQALILNMYFKSVAAWATAFAPLWAVVLGWGASATLARREHSAAARAGTAAFLLAALALSPALTRHAAMPSPLPAGPTIIGHVERAASEIRAVIPGDRPVFLLGNPMAAYLAGLKPYLQQIIHAYTLVPVDDAAVSRSGLWGPREIERWLGHEATFAIIDPNLLDRYEAVEVYRPVARRMRSLLHTQFVFMKRVDVPSVRLDLYRRVAASGG